MDERMMFIGDWRRAESSVAELCRFYGEETPAAHFVLRPRPYHGRLGQPDYPADQDVRRVCHNGEIKWRGGSVFLDCLDYDGRSSKDRPSPNANPQPRT